MLLVIKIRKYMLLLLLLLLVVFQASMQVLDINPSDISQVSFVKTFITKDITNLRVI